jgi:nitrite reductase/ring-hydroxylating ferredoxin subunit
MSKVDIGPTAMVPEGGRRVVEVDGVEIGLFRLGGRFIAYKNVCPHMGGPVCQGKMLPGTVELVQDDRTSHGIGFTERMNIICPWHAYEFDIATGEHPSDRRIRLHAVKVEIADDRLVLTLPDRHQRSAASA